MPVWNATPFAENQTVKMSDRCTSETSQQWCLVRRVSWDVAFTREYLCGGRHDDT
jgi:hypothetical protein